MSNKMIRTNLEGYDKQLFPHKLHELNRIYDDNVTDGITLGEIGARIDRFEKVGIPTTEDGYVSYRGLLFKAKKGKIAILFPWIKDKKNYNGYKLDRSISTYIKGEVSSEELDEILEKINLGIKNS